eukprot:15250954-Alexandrium_andersonii.AAC.1
MADLSETKFFLLVGLPRHFRGPVWARLPHLRGADWGRILRVRLPLFRLAPRAPPRFPATSVTPRLPGRPPPPSSPSTRRPWA